MNESEMLSVKDLEILFRCKKFAENEYDLAKKIIQQNNERGKDNAFAIFKLEHCEYVLGMRDKFPQLP